MDFEFTNRTTVDLVGKHTTDFDAVQPMLVSTQGPDALSLSTEELEGRINFLMKNRHGTPFEHTFFKFFIDAPIFVFREFHRHRIGWSYNEESGRYSQLRPKFYIPGPARAIKQVGKPGAYEYVPGTDEELEDVQAEIRARSLSAYDRYDMMLHNGVAKEVARMVLPVNIFSSMFASCNARSLMAFLSLRTKDAAALFPSFPMREINDVADELEMYFARTMPITHEAFSRNGRVCP